MITTPPHINILYIAERGKHLKPTLSPPPRRGTCAGVGYAVGTSLGGFLYGVGGWRSAPRSMLRACSLFLYLDQVCETVSFSQILALMMWY